jgi:phosphate transport system permease protein
MTKKAKYTNYLEFSKSEYSQKRTKKRYKAESRYKIFGLSAIIISLLFLAILLINIGYKSQGAFTNTSIKTNIYFDPSLFSDPENVSYRKVLINSLKERFPKISESRRERILLFRSYSIDARSQIKKFITNNPQYIGKNHDLWLASNSEIDQYLKEKSENISPFYLQLINEVLGKEAFKQNFSLNLIANGDSTYPELAGGIAAIMGSLMTMIIILLCSFPLAVLLALYLEEFAPQNKTTDFIEININNLAAIPSIIYGLLGLLIFIGIFNLPRSSSMVGGLTLSLLVLPVIVVAAKNSIKTIPQNIKDAALALGASPIQVALHHTLPLAMPGILTGTILATARAVGETAPLLMIGMVAFIVNAPQNFTDPATVLPVQIYLWSNNPESGFVEKTAAMILILLILLGLFNGLAIYLRRKFSRKF